MCDRHRLTAMQLHEDREIKIAAGSLWRTNSANRRSVATARQKTSNRTSEP